MEKLQMTWELFRYIVQGCCIGLLGALCYCAPGIMDSFIHHRRLRDSYDGRLSIAYMSSTVMSMFVLLVISAVIVFSEATVDLEYLTYLRSRVSIMVCIVSLVVCVCALFISTAFSPIKRER